MFPLRWEAGLAVLAHTVGIAERSIYFRGTNYELLGTEILTDTSTEFSGEVSFEVHRVGDALIDPLSQLSIQGSSGLGIEGSRSSVQQWSSGLRGVGGSYVRVDQVSPPPTSPGSFGLQGALFPPKTQRGTSLPVYLERDVTNC